MSYTHEDLLRLVHATRAVSIWDHDKGPIFWYAQNLPGPFYVNTEKVIGTQLAEKLVREITAIVAGTVDGQARAEQLNHLILDAFKHTPDWQRIVVTLAERARASFPAHSYQLVSGGERRDWLFSIPFAHICDVPHLFLFKDKTHFCAQNISAGQSALHVSDLINNAASFFDRWKPALDGMGISCAGNLSVALRGTEGLKRLKDIGSPTLSLVTIDAEFFRHLHAGEMISQATAEEISVFLSSQRDWALRYLMPHPSLFHVRECDSKSFERLLHFLRTDPWHLHAVYPDSFAALKKEAESRARKAA